MPRLSSVLSVIAAISPIFAAPAPEPAIHHTPHTPSHHGSNYHSAPPAEASPPDSSTVVGSGLPFAGKCDLSALSIQGAPDEIPEPSAPLTYVTIALGTQNYTCSSDGTYTAAGAVAELFDISCLSKPDGADTLVDQLMNFWEQSPKLFSTQGIIDFLLPATSDIVLGQHYFVPNPKTGEGISPKWDFTSQGSHKGNPKAFVTVERLAGAPAPTGEDDIDWLATNAIDGELSAQVYRTDTRGGKAPESCDTPGDTLEVKYTCKYWFFGGSVAGTAGSKHGNRLHYPNHSSSGSHSTSSNKNSNKEHHKGWGY